MYFSSNTNILYIILIIMVITNIMSGNFDLVSLLLTLPGVLVAITFHEYAHAKAADVLGDNTPRNQGRLTLNPLGHLDPFGFVMLIFAHIGWGKPVEINPRNFDRKISMSAGEAIVSFAGPLMNFILAILFTIIYVALAKFSPGTLMSLSGCINIMLINTIAVNIGLGVFNLIPLPPLDGSKVLMHFLPYNAKRWFEEHTQLFYIIFIIIWLTPIASNIISPIINGIFNGIFRVVSQIFSIF